MVDLMAWMDLKIPGTAKDELNMSSDREAQYAAYGVTDMPGLVWDDTSYCQADEVTASRHLPPLLADTEGRSPD
jgi:hypothetical protein